MTAISEETEVVATPEVAKSRLSIVVILSVLLGILSTVLVGGVLFHFHESNEMQGEVTTLSVALKEKSQALDEMKLQIEELSKQVYVLKEYSIARSQKTDKKEKQEAVAVTSTDTEASSPKAPDENGVSGSPTAKGARKPEEKKPEPQNCELVGKSPEEQAATLKRCVGMMDAPPGKSQLR